MRGVGSIIALVAVLAGCEEIRPVGPTARTIPARTEIWVASDMTALTDGTPSFEDASILSDDGRTVSLFGSANETVAFQLLIDAPVGGLDGVRVTPSTLSAEGDASRVVPAAAIRLFRMLPVKVTDVPAWSLRMATQEPQSACFYDPLAPFSARGAAQGLRLAPGERLALWVDVVIPPDARPGLYRGKLAVVTGFFEEVRLPLELKVFDLVLPNERPLAAVGGFRHGEVFRQFARREGRPYEPSRFDMRQADVRFGLDCIRDMMRLAHEHRLDLFDRQIHPKIRRDLQGRLKLNWDEYDAFVRPHLDGSAFDDRIACPAWPIPFADDWPAPQNYGGVDSQTYEATAAQVVALCGRHFRSLGAEEQMFAWPYRGDVESKAYGLFLRLAQIVRKADPGVPVLCQLPAAPPKMTGWTVPDGLADCVGILAPPAQWLDPAEGPKRRKPENPLLGVWFSPDLPPYSPGLSILSSPADVRAIAWFAMKYQCTGVFLPEVLNWPEEGVSGTPDDDKMRLFYSGWALGGPKAVLPSVRLKRLRRGLQDISYAWILQQRQREGLARAILNAMVRYGALDAVGDHYLDPRLDGWVANGPAWIEARRMLALEAQSAVHPQTRTDPEEIADQVRWRRFMELTSRLAVERVQTFVRAGELPMPDVTTKGPKPTVRSLRATVLVSLFNEYDRSVEASARIADLPSGWKPIVGEHRIPNFPPASRREAKLTIEGLDVPPTPNGKMPVSVQIQAGAEKPRTVRTDVAFLVAGRFNTPPTIDGDLQDWPARARASAGDFRLLGRRGQAQDDDATGGLARRQTIVFAMQDDKNLYFALRCNEPDLDRLVARPSNVVHYEQLLACGEDLVEILLDPGAKAAGPEDLYHILVKPNGVTVQEIGVSSDPPLGAARPFPLGARVAVGRQKDCWIVEMEIPRSAFGQDGKEEFWGVNFTRFAPQGLEASSWSGAERYFYDPRSLGTLFVPPPETP